MSKFIPVFKYPGGNQIPIPIDDTNITYKWIENLGGGILPCPIEWGTIRPDGEPAHGGVMTFGN